MPDANYRLRLPMMAMGVLALLAAMWAGLVRLGWGWPPLRPMLPSSHGALMISGFLGTVIGLERAVALTSLPQSLTQGGFWLKLPRMWTYIGPLLTGLGAIALIVGLPGSIGPLLIMLGSLSLTIVFALILSAHAAPYTITMAIGALLWLVGNGLWLSGWPVPRVVLWWSGFLILTIAGERLELNRVLHLSRTVQTLFGLTVLIFLAGLIIQFVNFSLGVRLVGLGIVAVALWLLRYDVARHTIKKSGLSRFIAACLLTGYGWLAVGGGLGILLGGATAGFRYDASLHAVFIGFVLSMIFGHAPIIFPTVIGKIVRYQSIFYSHLILLHLSLLLRVGGDLTGWLSGRQWGGLLNVVAILLFLANTVRSLRNVSTPISELDGAT